MSDKPVGRGKEQHATKAWVPLVNARHRKKRPGSPVIVVVLACLASIAVTGVEFWVAHRTGSAAAGADAWHNLTDALGIVVGLVGLRVARIPPSERLPWGPAGAEDMAQVVLACSMAAAAGGVLLGAHRRLTEDAPAPTNVAHVLAIGVGAATVNFLSSRLLKWAARRSDSELLHALAAHAEGDMAVSLAVAATAGVILLGLPPLLDTVAALMVGVWIAWLVLKTGRAPLMRWLGAVDRELTAAARSALGGPGAPDVHVRMEGRTAVVVLRGAAPGGIVVEVMQDALERSLARPVRLLVELTRAPASPNGTYVRRQSRFPTRTRDGIST